MITAFRKYIRGKIFDRQFNKLYNGLLLGELYDLKVKVLGEMKVCREAWKQDYINGGVSIGEQIEKFIKSTR